MSKASITKYRKNSQNSAVNLRQYEAKIGLKLNVEKVESIFVCISQRYVFTRIRVINFVLHKF